MLGDFGDVIWDFRDENRIRPAGDAGVQCQPPRISKPRAGSPSFNSTKLWAAAGRSKIPSGLE